MDILDENRRWITARLFRDSCVSVGGNFLKDLSVTGRDLRHTAIVDNSPQTFGYQLSNGIPIKSWFDDDHDRCLLDLLPFLERLATADDVRPLIAAEFQLQRRVDRARLGAVEPNPWQ